MAIPRELIGRRSMTSLRIRRLAHRAYNFVAPYISRTGITKIKIGSHSLGYFGYGAYLKALYYGLDSTPIDVHGMVMYHKTPTKWFGWLYAFDYEPETRRYIQGVITPGMTVVDAGAHIGYYTLLAAKLVGTGGKVFSFEPHPAHYALLVKNIRTNGLGEIVEPFRVAVSDREGRERLFIGSGMASSLFKVSGFTSETDTVDVTSVDMFFARQGWPPVDVMKVDIEGSEKFALEGMRQLVKRNPDLKLVIELNPAFLEAAGTTPEELLKLIGDLGLRRVRLLSGSIDSDSFELPRHIEELATIGRSVAYVNLACERS